MEQKDINEIAQQVERRLSKTLKSHLESIIEPYQKDKLQILQEEFAKVQRLFSEIESTTIGAIIIQRAVKRINKKDSEKVKDNNYAE